ncbi:hypothetical protein [Streptomyces indicus]|uniref:Lipoprotein n=1 Tax=Streptomyces indicus TaxID=417292 RepID=A0A1G8WMH5_9ACTN|nr:hypothetical protein [Streptomyces indicus]SDJ79562.1 hypothetical protein SAMN05421806_102561 [Streptomyces indicus]
MRSPRTVNVLGATVTAAALAVGGLAGTAAAADDNGVANLEAEQILRRSAAAFKTAESVHLEIDDEAARSGARETELSVDRQGNCTGEMKLPDDGGSFEFLVLADRTAWIKPDDKMVENLLAEPNSTGSADPSASADAKDIEGKYIKRNLNRAPELEGLKTLCNLDTLQSLSGGRLTDPVKGEESEVDDTKVIAVKGRAHGQEHTLYVAAEGQPYPLKSESADGKLTVELSEFNELVTVTPPEADEVATL